MEITVQLRWNEMEVFKSGSKYFYRFTIFLNNKN